MRRVCRVSLLICLVWAAPCWPARAQAPERVSVASLVDRVLTRLAAAEGLRAEFLQVNHWVVMEEADSARGVLNLAPPHLFRLEYTQPKGHLVGCDGRYVWTYVPEEHQVLRARWTATTGWGDFFIQGLKEGADSLATVSTEPGGRRVARVVLGPHIEWGMLDLIISFDLASDLPVGYAYHDEEGNHVQFIFAQIAFPERMDDELFQFAPPEGYELLDVD